MNICRKNKINVIFHFPKTEEGKRELACRAASVHADLVNHYIQKLDCPAEQKQNLLNAVISTEKSKMNT